MVGGIVGEGHPKSKLQKALGFIPNCSSMDCFLHCHPAFDKKFKGGLENPEEFECPLLLALQGKVKLPIKASKLKNDSIEYWRNLVEITKPLRKKAGK